MASQINASNSGFGGIVSTGDSSGVLQLQTTGTTALTIDTSQNVGIGTTSPAGKLDIGSGNLNFSSTAQRITGDFSNATVANRVIFQSSTTNGNSAITAMPNGTATTSSFQAFNTNDPANTSATQVLALSTESSFRNAINGTGTYLPMTFYTGGSERMRIDSGGGVLIGTTTNTPGYKLYVKGGDGNQLILDNAGSTYTTMNYYNNGANKLTLFWDNTTPRYYVVPAAGGGVYLAAGGTSWTSTSDERVKDIIEPITDAANKVSTLRAVIGKYKTDEEGTRRAFLIAQDVHQVFPEAVDTANENEYGLRYQDTIPLLVAAIQEQQTIINDLKARIETLESK